MVFFLTLQAKNALSCEIATVNLFSSKNLLFSA